MYLDKAIFIFHLFFVLAFIPRNLAVITENESPQNDDDNRVYAGVPTSVPSLVMGMQMSPYYQWDYTFTGIILKDTCLVIGARYIVDYEQYPIPYPLFPNPKSIWVARPQCDMQYHISEIFLNTPGYNFTSRENDIAIAKVQRPIYFGNKICGGPPVYPQWVSCDAGGPPPGYKDCIFASFGLNYQLGSAPLPLAPEFIGPNMTKVEILTEYECNKRRVFEDSGPYVPFVPKDEVCMSTYDNNSPTCEEDRSGVVMCKYWNPPNHGNGWENNLGQGWGNNQGNGWGHSQGSYSNGDGWKEPSRKSGGWGQGNDWVIVGHRVYDYGKTYYCYPNSAAFVIKFGSPTYRDLFTNCEMVCSNNLPSGQRCKGNPSPSLGPVYCTAEPIPETEREPEQTRI